MSVSASRVCMFHLEVIEYMCNACVAMVTDIGVLLSANNCEQDWWVANAQKLKIFRIQLMTRFFHTSHQVSRRFIKSDDPIVPHNGHTVWYILSVQDLQVDTQIIPMARPW